MKIPHSMILTVALFAAVAAQGDAAPEIVASTAHIQEVVQRLNGGAPVKTLIPPAMCPGHFDVRPGDIARLRRGGVLLIHDWQREMQNIRSVVSAAGLPDARLRVAPVTENWMIPSAREAASAAVARILTELIPEQAEQIATRDEAYRESIHAHGDAMRARLQSAGAADINVMCEAILEDLLAWLGFQVVATYGRSEDMGAASMAHLVRTGREKQVALVVDNLQSSGARLGPAIARDIGAEYVVISNFPGGFDGAPTWEATSDRNAQLLIEAADRWRGSHE